MIRGDGWLKHCIWEHSATVHELYARRCRLEAEEMTCAAQAAEMLAARCEPGDVVLDVGCGSGYFFHSLRKRRIAVEYFGVDASPSLIDIGRRWMPEYGLDAKRLQTIRIEDLAGEADHVVCMNVLSNIDNYHRPLERILEVARQSVILRESLADVSSYQYVRDKYLDEGVDLSVHVNTYDRQEVCDFMQARGFAANCIKDRRTGGVPERVIDYLHYWEFIDGTRLEVAQEEAA